MSRLGQSHRKTHQPFSGLFCFFPPLHVFIEEERVQRAQLPSMGVGTFSHRQRGRSDFICCYCITAWGNRGERLFQLRYLLWIRRIILLILQPSNSATSRWWFLSAAERILLVWNEIHLACVHIICTLALKFTAWAPPALNSCAFCVPSFISQRTRCFFLGTDNHILDTYKSRWKHIELLWFEPKQMVPCANSSCSPYI